MYPDQNLIAAPEIKHLVLLFENICTKPSLYTESICPTVYTFVLFPEVGSNLPLWGSFNNIIAKTAKLIPIKPIVKNENLHL